METKAARAEIEKEQTEISSEEFWERFAKAEDASEILWSSVASDNAKAQSAAAEQEHSLWAYELKLVTDAVQRNLSKEETEQFKTLEADWIRERDGYAAQKAAGSQSKSGQTAEYGKALADKTKERCYWILSEYGTVIDGQNGQ